MLKIKSNIDKVEKRWEIIKKKFPSVIKQGLDHLGYLIYSKIDENIAIGKYGVKTDTGRLRGGLNHKTTGNTLIVGDNVKYAKIQEYGGVITPKNSKYLRFQYKGSWHTKKSVRIPAHYYMTKSIYNNMNKWRNVFGDFIISRISNV